LGMLQFFGGIDPDLVLAGFAATVIVVLSLAAVGIAASVLSRRARDAIALTYLVGVTYIVISVVIYALSTAGSPLRWTIDVFGYTITSEEVAYPVVCGNPLFMVVYVLNRRASAGLDVFAALGHFALFHTIVIAVLVTWAGLRLRAIALRQTFGSQRRPFFRRARRAPAASASAKPQKPCRVRAVVDVLRPAIGNWPIIWKEVFVDTGLKLAGIGRVIVIGLVAMSFVPAAFIFWFTIVDTGARYGSESWWSADRWDDFGRGMNAYLRASGTVVSSLVFLAVAIPGPGPVSREPDPHPLHPLLT